MEAITVLAAVLALLAFAMMVYLLIRQNKEANADKVAKATAEAIEHLNIEHEARLRTVNEQWEERLKRMEEQTRLQFKELSRSVLDETSEKLKRDNGENMEQIVNPMRERLDMLSQAMLQMKETSASTGKALDARIDDLIKANADVSAEARNLSQALHGDARRQGDWGEMVLTTLLKRAGLQEGIGYDVQTTVATDSGETQRPDLIIHLPSGQKLIVDSKVSLTAYLRMCEAGTKAEMETAGREHVASMRRHVKTLGDKQYHKSVKGAIEHVLMFVPNEPAWIEANRLDPDLWMYAHQHHVVIVSPTHLLSVVHLIVQMWRQDSQDRNAAEIARVAGLLHDSFFKMLDKLEKIGTGLQTVTRTYEDTRRYLDENNSQSLINRAHRLKELGAKTSK